MSRRTITLLFSMALVGISSQASASEDEVLERFLAVSRETREHRADMLARFSQETPVIIEDKSKGLRIYWRWAPPHRERLRKLTLSFESDGRLSGESISVRDESDWGLLWYSALLSRPTGEVGVLRVKADVESRRFRTPFESVRELRVFEGSLPIVLPPVATPLRMVIELDSDSPFAERRQSSRALRLSLIPGDDSPQSAGAR